ncbi:hypothetical protein GO013_11335 [Pseudodesulfovibrio sp. JC047]|uniref:hypothetical protein n=1 Tax=Pseudodesulfovibrio sp. JC047 TaxID=2683199 RepID=UPI0013D2C010|nr:hypothetical protein [Pseudodesulfovibrio sp. JC047]NDV20015.1 hypothetical protein [Pseudodesulfovibrio sp. JC047]
MVKDTRIFRTQTEAWQFLDGEGFKSNSSSFGRHCQAGLVGKNTDGAFEAEALLTYARAKLNRKTSGKKVTQEEKDRDVRKKEAEINLTEFKAERERIKLEKEQGKLIERNHVQREIGARAGVLSSMFKSEVQKRGRELVETVEGKPGKTRDLIRALIEMFDDMATEYSNMKTIEVMISDEDSM